MHGPVLQFLGVIDSPGLQFFVLIAVVNLLCLNIRGHHFTDRPKVDLPDLPEVLLHDLTDVFQKEISIVLILLSK